MSKSEFTLLRSKVEVKYILTRRHLPIRRPKVIWAGRTHTQMQVKIYRCTRTCITDVKFYNFPVESHRIFEYLMTRTDKITQRVDSIGLYLVRRW